MAGDEEDKKWIENAQRREQEFLEEKAAEDNVETGEQEEIREDHQNAQMDGEDEAQKEERTRARRERRAERQKKKEERRKRKGKPEEDMEIEDDKQEEKKRRKEEEAMSDGDGGDRATGSSDPNGSMHTPAGGERRDDGERAMESTGDNGDEVKDMAMKLMVKMIRGVDLTEVYSPERIITEARKFGLRTGLAMDLLTGWDFDQKEDRARAEEHQVREKPLLIVGSPMCTMFSALQALSRWTEEKEAKYDKSVKHMQWACKLYERQMEEGRIFLHEHPDAATSWRLPCVKNLAKKSGVYVVTVDQCMFGQVVRDRKGRIEGRARKRTKFMTNSWWIAQELQRRCDGQHEHVQLLGGRAAQTARYTPELCKAVCRGLMREKKEREMGVRAVAMVEPLGKKGEVPDSNEYHDENEAKREKENVKASIQGEAWDDVSGVKLNSKKVKAAREEEIGYFRKKGVYTKITRKEAEQMGCKVVKVRWIDINKGDEANPVYRSRLVAKEFREGENDEENLFAGTPPLEALKLLISDAATVEKGQLDDKVVLIADVSRAFFEAKAKRKVCVELVEEDMTEEDRREDRVGLLELSMYGTRDAAMNWQEEVARCMRKWGFRRGRYNPCMYWNREKNLKVLVHGDDFVAVGKREDAGWLKEKLGERFEIKSTTIGSREEEEKEGRVLNRIVRLTAKGWEYEADQRHAEILIEALKLKEARSVGTPGEDEKDHEEEENKEELGPEDATRYRALAARANYLALDRPDVQYAVKEICRSMSKPTVGGKKKLKRLGRYLIGKPRMVSRFDWRGEESEVETFGDSNWAGCKTTGRSTSGGSVTIGGHVIKTWSHTQKTVALSSAEAELTALVKATCEGIGVTAMLEDWGHHMGQVVYADANAALGVVKRKGAGKLRHINIGMLWVQEKAAEEKVAFRKIDGTKNPADLMTKNLNQQTLSEHCEKLNLEERTGRASKSSELCRGINSFALVRRFLNNY